MRYNIYIKCALFSSVCLLVGFISSLFQIDAIANWYPNLHKPLLTPSNFFFPVAWILLYILMGCSFAFLQRQHKFYTTLENIFYIQLIFNFLWSIGFFYMKSPLLGMIDIIILDVLVFLYICYALSNKLISAVLFLPYLFWLIFASYLNLYIYLYN